MRLSDYKTVVFDCDGVILDSNRVKTSAFFKTALPYGQAAAHQLVAYHTSHGGISRFKKFEYFLQAILQREATAAVMDQLLAAYAREVSSGLMQCAIATGLPELRASTPDSRWLVVSGGAQSELREIFEQRGLAEFFDGGIFGSPDTKEEILERQISEGAIEGETLFIGDSRYDHVASSAYGLGFVFLSGWTEFEGWQEYCNERGLAVRTRLSDLL
ncbi:MULTISPECIES: HAD family hydrolase [unclassified Pseudomonas]|uniref:HAD family hydrolase n=1 Tax=unclassified Pseudomonas TaxID=196821 RepID=UPI003826CA60